jgi:hypothetical protein
MLCEDSAEFGTQTLLFLLTKIFKKIRGLSPRANYTDRETAACRRKLVPTFVDRGVSREQRDGFLRPYSRISRLGATTFTVHSEILILQNINV